MIKVNVREDDFGETSRGIERELDRTGGVGHLCTSNMVTNQPIDNNIKHEAELDGYGVG